MMPRRLHRETMSSIFTLSYANVFFIGTFFSSVSVDSSVASVVADEANLLRFRR